VGQVIHGTVVLGPPQNTAQRLSFFSSIKYTIGGHRYTTDGKLIDGEHIRKSPLAINNTIAIYATSSGYLLFGFE
jgi:hypothetical protein